MSSQVTSEALRELAGDMAAYDIDYDPNFFQKIRDQVDRAVIERVIKRTSGNQSKTAQLLKINRGTLRKRMKELNIDNRGVFNE